jgi:hypothetical protein
MNIKHYKSKQLVGVTPFQIAVDDAIYVQGMHKTVFFCHCDKFSFLSDAWETNHLMEKDHMLYCGLLSGPYM